MRVLTIKDRRKFNRFLIMVSLVLAIFVYAFISIAFPTTVKGLSDTTSIVIVEGDTIWDIASTIDSNKDIREVVYDIYSINKLSRSKPIQPGQIIKLPVY